MLTRLHAHNKARKIDPSIKGTNPPKKRGRFGHGIVAPFEGTHVSFHRADQCPTDGVLAQVHTGSTHHPGGERVALRVVMVCRLIESERVDAIGVPAFGVVVLHLQEAMTDSGLSRTCTNLSTVPLLPRFYLLKLILPTQNSNIPDVPSTHSPPT